MRRKAYITLVAGLAMVVAGCGSSGSSSSEASNTSGGGSTSSSSSSTAAATQSGGGGGQSYALELVQGVRNEPFYITMACGAKAAAQAAGSTLTVTGPNQWDVQEQTQVVHSVTAKHPDATLIAPVDDTAMIAPMKQMKQSGVTIVQVDTHVTDMSLGVSWIASNNTLGGKRAADTLAKLIGGKGTVLVVNVQAGTSTTDARGDGFVQQMKAKYPNITVLPMQYDKDDPAKAAQIVTSTLSAHPDLAGIFATNLNSTVGAGTGLRETGKIGDVKLVGFDAEPKEIQMLKKGEAQALIAQEPYKIGQLGVQQALKALAGKPTTAKIKTKLIAITAKDTAKMKKYAYKTGC